MCIKTLIAWGCQHKGVCELRPDPADYQRPVWIAFGRPTRANQVSSVFHSPTVALSWVYRLVCRSFNTSGEVLKWACKVAMATSHGHASCQPAGVGCDSRAAHPLLNLTNTRSGWHTQLHIVQLMHTL